MELFDPVGGARLAVDALGVEAVHLHVLQHHLQHHGNRVFVTDQMTHPHTKVLPVGVVVVLNEFPQKPEVQPQSSAFLIQTLI